MTVGTDNYPYAARHGGAANAVDKRGLLQSPQSFCTPPELPPMRIVLDSPATPGLPISILLLPVVRFRPHPWPNAMLSPPVVLFTSALQPMAVLLPPVVLRKSALIPLAVLLPPVVLKPSASKPVAVLPLPVVFSWSAKEPMAVLLA